MGRENLNDWNTVNMLRLRLVVGNVVRSLRFGGGGYTSSTRQQGFSIMGEYMYEGLDGGFS